jgi:mannose-6-phosphate isomerase-like protein (cupin superfamily)
MSIEFSADAIKDEVFSAVQQYIDAEGFTVVSKDFTRPWGGFFVLDEQDAEKFIAAFFPGYTKAQLLIGDKLSPKFLIVSPGQRLSWQYHHRRAEIWRVLKNEVQVATSDTDEQTEPKVYNEGDVIVLQKGERHRLIGYNTYGIVAEIWQHTDPQHPSDEDDIVRLQDDFGR